MNIGIVTTSNYNNASGFVRFELELIRALCMNAQHHFTLFTRPGGQIRERKEIINRNNVTIEEVRLPRLLWREAISHISLKCDVYVYIGLQTPFFIPNNAVVILLDCFYKLNKAKTLRDRLMEIQFDVLAARIIKAGCRIVAISIATKQDFMQIYGVSDKRIAVVYPGVTELDLLTESKVDGVPESFFLFVGTVKGRKNVLGLLRAYCALKKTGVTDISLVIVGRFYPETSYWKSIQDYIAENRITGVHFVGPITDAQLTYVYRRAFALVFPSFFEGFGFPVIEAMRLGVPVITSRTTALGEVGGTAAYLVDPEDVDSIMSAMYLAMNDRQGRENRIAAGLKYSQNFTWEKSALEILEECRKAKVN